MLCGSPEMLASIKSLLEKMKFEEGNTTRPGDFVVERAFVEK
jgi:ferredoxin--NADP+ reductase